MEHRINWEGIVEVVCQTAVLISFALVLSAMSLSMIEDGCECGDECQCHEKTQDQAVQVETENRR